MRKNTADVKKKYLAGIVLFSVLLCSFLGLGCDAAAYGTAHIPLSQSNYVSESVDLDEFITSEELAVSTSQVAFIRQLSTRKSSVGNFRIDFVINCLFLILYFAFLAFLSQYCAFVCGSHRFIIRYIHNKDGQKA